MRFRTPLTNALDSSVPKLFASSDRLVEDDRAGHVGAMLELPGPEAQDVAVDARHPLYAPVRRRLGDLAVQLVARRVDAAYGLVGVLAPLGSASPAKLRQKSAIA